MIPFFVVHDVTALPDGDLVLGGTDEYIDPKMTLSAARFEGKPVSILLRGGARIEATSCGIAVHTALTGRRNVYLRIPRIRDDLESLKGAIVSVEQ